MATLEKIEKDIIRTKAKISEYQQKLRNLEAQKVEAENLQIVNLVKAVKLSTPQLTVLLMQRVMFFFPTSTRRN